MNGIGKPERATQNRVIALFRDELGYRYLADRANCSNKSNIEEELFGSYLTKAGYSKEQISRALYLLRTQADKRGCTALLERVGRKLDRLLPRILSPLPHAAMAECALGIVHDRKHVGKTRTITPQLLRDFSAFRPFRGFAVAFFTFLSESLWRRPA